MSRRPLGLLAIGALVAILLNCYPIVFCGRSFVSPDEDNVILHGVDAAAIMCHDVPTAFVEKRALAQHGTLPFWNRYKNAGDPLLTEGISMLGDPLHFIVLAGGGSAWAWDGKFLMAKWLFAFGCGCLILRLTRELSLALIFTVAAAYCGLFHFVPNHPGFFVFCYTPWILLSVLRALTESGPRRIAWGLLWLVVNTGCFNAGHVEVAVVCIGGLNLTGFLCVLAESRGWRWRVVVVMAALTAVFAGLNAPVWMPFLSYLPDTFNLHTGVAIRQFPFYLLAGLFDDSFYQSVQEGSLAEGPGGTMFVLVGLLFGLASFRELRREKFFFINLATLVVWGGFVFGYVPVAVVEHLPLIPRIGHIRADFSYLAILQSLIASAYGCLAVVRLTEAGSFWRRWAMVAGGVVMIELLFFWATRTVEKPADFLIYVAVVSVCALAAPPVYLFCRRNSGAARLAGWVAFAVLFFVPQARLGLYTFGPERWLLQPGRRGQLDSASAAVESMQQGASEPFRATGLEWDLYGGYGAVYGLEDIKGISALMNRYYMDLCVHYPGVERDDYLLELSDPVAAKNLLSMLNVRYLVLDPSEPRPSGLPYRLTGIYDLTLFENDEVWPRAFFVNRIRTYQGVADFVALLKQYGESPFAAISESDLARRPALRVLAESPAELVTRSASGYRLEANETSFEIDAPTSGLAVVSETYVANGFTVEVNGVAQEVLRLNHAFKGVYLDKPGHYRVTFRYVPPYWTLASAMFLASAALIGAAAVAMMRSDWSFPKPSAGASGPELALSLGLGEQ